MRELPLRYHGMCFDTWMKRVDFLVARAIGVGASDLPDRCWADRYEEALSPEEAIEAEYGDLTDEDALVEILFD